MPRKPSFKVTHTKRGWKVEEPSTFSGTGERERHYFKTREKGKEFADTLKERVQAHGANAATIRPSLADEATRAAGFTYPTQRMLHDLELRGAEIDQQSVLNPKRTQVAQDLGQLLQPTFSIADSCILRLLRLFAAERLSSPVPSDGTPKNWSGIWPCPPAKTRL